MYRKKGRSWTKHIDFMLLDVLCMQIAFIVSYICRFGLNNPYIDKDYRILAVAFLLIDFFVEIVSDAFKNVLKRGYLDEFIVTCKHVALVEIITTFFLFTTQMGEIYSRMSYYIMIPIYILVSYLGRMVLKKIIKKRGFASSKESLFVIAPEKLLRETLQGLKENGFGYTQIVAAATDADLNGKTICEIPIVANHDGIVDYACEEWVDEVLIPPCAESEYPYEMADIFLEMGIAVHRGITKNKVMAGSFNQIEKIGDYTVITASLNYARTTQLLAKRGMDILGGLVGCIITLIVTIFVGPAIYIASPGPIFFAQERIGRNGRKFKMYKFRSMYMDAEERKKELMAQNKVSDGMMFKMDFDPRIIGNKILPDGTKKTGIGQFIRKTSIDELPQFWNILKGDMSLVGTRPPTLDEWEKYEPHHRARMSFRPGLTGLWQVSGRSNITDFEEVVRLDTQYISGYFNPTNTESYEDKKRKYEYVDILLTGRITEAKSQEEAVMAIAELKKRGLSELVRLHFAGSVPVNSKFARRYYNRILDLIKKYNIEKQIIFHGEVSSMDLLRQNMDIELMCAERETFGWVTVEGMRSGLLVIGANTGATPEIITNMKTGLLYTHGDARDLADKIEWVLKNPSSADEIRKNGKKFSDESFTIEENGTDVYRAIMSCQN